MNSNRLKVLLGIAGVLVALMIWNVIAHWGLVTVHVQSKPLSTVIKSIERQGGITIVTNADQTKPISMDVDLVTAPEAVDVLAARLDGNWSVGYVAGPSKADVSAGVAALSDGQRDRDFRTFGFGGFGGGGGPMDISDTVIDARQVVWKVSTQDGTQLQDWLNQLSMKTGLMAMVPRNWDPQVAKAPAGGKSASALRAMVKSVKGSYEEIFIVRVSNDDRTADNGGGPDRVARSEGGFGQRGGGPGGRDGGRQNFNPDWIAERAEARIAQLPKEEQAEAKKNFDDMRAFFEKMRALPDDQRQTAMQQFFDQPDVQQKMADRQAARDEKSGPEKRADRARNYIQRKAQITGKSSS
jgi:hypothetical protein